MRRLARWQYWLAFCGLFACAFALDALRPVLPLEIAAGLTFVATFGLIVLNVFLARARFLDLGWDPDDAFVVLVPVANLWVIGRCLFSGTPSDEARERRIQKWSRAYGPAKIGALTAVTVGLWVWVRALPVFLPVAIAAGLAYGGANELVVRFLDWIRHGDKAVLESTTQGLGGAAGFLLLFAVIQLARRQAVSRASWIPALLTVPLALLALAMWLRDSRDLGMAVLSLPYEALDLVWSSIVGGSLAFVWIAVGDRLEKGDSLGDAISKTAALARDRWLDVVAVHGGAQTAIWVGLQVLLPGIHYAITYSFVDLAALFHPERPAYTWSTEVARGIRTRVFLTQFLGFLLYLVPSLGIIAFTCGLDPNAWVTAFMDPTTAPWYQHALEGTLWVLAAALIKLSLLQLYRDRVALLTSPVPTITVPTTDTTNPFAPPSEARG